MIFECIDTAGKSKESWNGRIAYLKNYGTHYEMKIESRSGIWVIFGKTDHGGFACMPDFGAGCHLAHPADKFWNTEKFVQTLGKVDGITVASALYAIADKVKF
ncbi:MAG: hypothetical protein XD91_1778 [Clostridiales bacterium 38_11]|nr:MAG: hypothetical protein XD91_1778 [Clostridiales bacterium 38_11]HBH12096.1 hypothetical protein [Clostridiales bacterium]